jgi:all-trans-retinol 13,14-reductase
MEQGGEVRCGARVTAIPTVAQRALGVTLAKGEFLEGGLVIFTGHPRRLADLCQPEAFRPAFRNRLLESRDTIGTFALALAWNHPDCVLAQRDAFLYNSWDTGVSYRQKFVGTDATPGMVFLSAASRPVAEGLAVMALIGMTPEDMAPFEETSRGNRTEAYREAKASVAERVLSVLQRRWPAQAQNLRVMDLATPLTFRDFTLTPRGTAYGILKSASAFRHSQFSAETRIRNLFLAGQSIIQPGVLGALISGVHAAGVILGRDYLLARIKAAL